ncbi:DUF3795 domain-containing protein [Planctomycetota bacterium]
MKELQYGPCGLFCGACGADDCGGCRSDRIDDSVRQCKFRKCTKEKNLDFCCYCGDYPCAELHEFMNDKWPHHGTMEANLKYIKNNGVQKWLQAQQQEWSCTGCGAEIMWYQKTCRCGQLLEAWEVPAS